MATIIGNSLSYWHCEKTLFLVRPTLQLSLLVCVSLLHGENVILEIIIEFCTQSGNSSTFRSKFVILPTRPFQELHCKKNICVSSEIQYVPWRANVYLRAIRDTRKLKGIYTKVKPRYSSRAESPGKNPHNKIYKQTPLVAGEISFSGVRAEKKKKKALGC